MTPLLKQILWMRAAVLVMKSLRSSSFFLEKLQNQINAEKKSAEAAADLAAQEKKAAETSEEAEESS